MKLWDVRSTAALHTVHEHGSKALCVGWRAAADGEGAQRIVSGGADSELRASVVAPAASK